MNDITRPEPTNSTLLEAPNDGAGRNTSNALLSAIGIRDRLACPI